MSSLLSPSTSSSAGRQPSISGSSQPSLSSTHTRKPTPSPLASGIKSGTSSATLKSSHSPSSGSSQPLQRSSISGSETVIDQLVSAKRSLTSIQYLARANEIRSSAKKLIDASTAESVTVREASKRPQDGLQRVRLVRDSLAETQNGSEDRLAPWLQKLDTANYRLKETMDDLRSTMVHAALSPPEEANNWTQKSLLSFIDEAGVEGVRRNVYAAIDEAKATKPKLMESTTEFLNAAKAAEDRDQASLREYAVLQAVPPQFSSILESLDQGAADVAEDLDSLVKHYDLCMTAFRYTENFVEAAKTISMDPPPDYPVGHKLDHSLKKPLEPISEEERREMLQIVAKDAAEVDDVVVSIQDRVIEMEEQMERIEVYSRGMKDLIRDGEESRKDFGRAVTLIIGTEAALENFHAAWQDLDGMFADYLGELDSLSEVYTGFLTAYDGLIVEVARRGHAKQQRLKVVASATRALEQLYIQELGERDAFRERHGDSLPTDLWPGLMDRPLKFVVSQAKDDGLPIPELPSDVVEAAAKRLGRAT